jgi:expansin (peptidoglycan-binding protein)
MGTALSNIGRTMLLFILLLSGICCGERPGPLADFPDSLDIINAQGVSCYGPTHSGYATYYTEANGDGNCMFGPSPNDLMVGAMNESDYAGSAICGATVAIQGPRGTIAVRIVDRCPGCSPSSIDLSPLAFSRIADLSLGVVPITWRLIAANVQGNIIYHFKDGSNQWWTAVQVRNHRYPIARFEYRNTQGTWTRVPRESYNYFVASPGMGPGPYTFRVTDVYGATLVDTGIPHIENGNVSGAGQFPFCPERQTD